MKEILFFVLISALIFSCDTSPYSLDGEIESRLNKECEEFKIIEFRDSEVYRNRNERLYSVTYSCKPKGGFKNTELQFYLIDENDKIIVEDFKGSTELLDKWEDRENTIMSKMTVEERMTYLNSKVLESSVWQKEREDLREKYKYYSIKITQ